MSDEIPSAEMRQHLDRILRSAAFANSPSRRLMLDYLGKAAIKRTSLTEWTVAEDVLGKADLPPEDRAVGVICSRVRKSLSRYYADEGKHDLLIISVTGLALKAERREAAQLPVPEGDFIAFQPQLSAALDRFFGPDRACVVTGQPQSGFYHLDGEPLNSSIGNLVPLCEELRRDLEAIQQGKRRTPSSKLEPKRLAEKLAAKHFQQWRVPNAYGCAALAFYMGAHPYGQESPGIRAFRLSDVIHYARHHFFEPLMHHVIERIALPFLTRLEVLDPIPAMRLSLQFTALLEEAGNYESAVLSLRTAQQCGSMASSDSFERGSLNAFTLLRRRAQLLAERSPQSRDFDALLRSAQEHADELSRAHTLNVVQVHRWLRLDYLGLSSTRALGNAHELLSPFVSKYSRGFDRDRLVIPEGVGAADFSETFLLAGITACRLRTSGWKQYAAETVDIANALMHRGGHILPAEYGNFITNAANGINREQRNMKAVRMLRAAQARVRPPLRPHAQENIASIVKCLSRLRSLESRRTNQIRRGGPDL